jgi:hypothetical protein
MIDEIQARKALRTVQVEAHRQWLLDRKCADLAEYEDAAIAALTSCVARFDPERGVQLHTFAEPRIHGAVQDALAAYETWRHGRYWRDEKPWAQALRPPPEPEPAWHASLLRVMPALDGRDRTLLLQILAGEELVEVAGAEGMAYITVYKRYRHLVRTLRNQLAPKEAA